ncbi:MAG: FliI/YscN family ATPase [Planctomycetes bacterium]|nr:FliI/YscN family ATPase [Planctomycetota bacterium]
MSFFAHQKELIATTQPTCITGKLSGVTGLMMLVDGLRAPVGSMCAVHRQHGDPVDAQVVGFRDGQTILMPLTTDQGLSRGDRVVTSAALKHVPVGRQMLGRVVNGLAKPIDEKGGFAVESHYPVQTRAPAPLARTQIDEPLSVGIRSIDAFHSLGRGQRLGLFAGTGVGKSVLLGMIARGTSSDVNVLALIGERGREVGDFIRRDLGEEGMKKTVMVVSTSDESPVMRVRACFVATAIAEYFRDQGADVLLMMDSITRVAMAQRQIGLAAGEPPATKGYTPSVFALLPKILERAGRTETGSITGLYTVLVEGDDVNEPISDAVRGTLDGHISLSRKLSNRGHYPAISTLESISRVMPDLVSPEHREAAQQVRGVLAVWDDIEDLVNIGAYAAGSNVEYDIAVNMKPKIDAFLRQQIEDVSEFAEAVDGLCDLSKQIAEMRARLGGSAAGSTA